MIDFFLDAFLSGLAFYLGMCKLGPKLMHHPPRPFFAWGTVGFMAVYMTLQLTVYLVGHILGISQ